MSEEALMKLQEAALKEGEPGAIAVGVHIIDRELMENVAAYAKFMQKLTFFSEGLIELLAGILGVMFDIPYIDKLTSFGIKDTLVGFYKRLVKKDPYLIVTTTAIEGFNFDASETVGLVIDGTAVTESITTDANGYFKYEPSTALSSGAHIIVAYTKNKAVSVKITL